MALVDIANNAGGKIGGFGDQLSGEAFVTAAQLTADADKVSQWINDKYPPVRKKIIRDFAAIGCPFRETRKFADLGDDLHDNDIAISTIVSASTVVTVTTAEDHGRVTGDTVFLSDIEGTLVTSLNGTTPTITVVDDTSFTLDEVIGVDATWDHTADSGIISDCPESGAWQYAFALPSDFFCMVRQCDESYTVTDGVRKEYQYDVILNRDGDGFVLLTNDLTNSNADSAYIEYCIDQETFALFSPAFEECIAMLMAAELCVCLSRNLETRQKLLAEYRALTVPDAMAYNQSQFNNSAKTVPDYSGGRSKVLRGTANQRNNHGYTAI